MDGMESLQQHTATVRAVRNTGAWIQNEGKREMIRDEGREKQEKKGTNGMQMKKSKIKLERPK
jgi:hypothetical protein